MKYGQQRLVAGRKNYIFFLCPLDGEQFTSVLWDYSFHYQRVHLPIRVEQMQAVVIEIIRMLVAWAITTIIVEDIPRIFMCRDTAPIGIHSLRRFR